VNDATAFPEFRKDALQRLGPLVMAARSLLEIGREMMRAQASEPLQAVAKEITQTVANSMESVLLLSCNGCGVDAFKIVRTMFEAAVTIGYLDKHPELVQDYRDFIWIIRKKYLDYRIQMSADKAKPITPEKVREIGERYEQVKDRFKGLRWCKRSLKDMAKEVNAELEYGGIYLLGSSMTHSDVLAIVAGAGDSGDVEPVPSEQNVCLAMQMALGSYSAVLRVFDKTVNLGRSDSIEAAWRTQFKNASQ
jgi:hypothetical protein